MTFLNFVVAHKSFLLTLCLLIVSELLPFTKGNVNGILQGLANLLKGSGAKELDSASK